MHLVCFGWWRLLPSFLFPAVDLSPPTLHILQAATRLLRFVGTQGTRHALKGKRDQPIHARAYIPLSYDDTLLLSPTIVQQTKSAHPFPRAPQKEDKREQGAGGPKPAGQSPPPPVSPLPPNFSQGRKNGTGRKAARLVGGRRGRRGRPGSLALAGGVLLGGVLGDDRLVLRLFGLGECGIVAMPV